MERIVSSPNHQKPVNLTDVIEALELLPESWSAYANRLTGEVVSISDDAFEGHEALQVGDELYGEADQEMIALVGEILKSNDFAELPNKFDLDEWSMMRDFCNLIDDSGKQKKLFAAIHGNGAFRRFKNFISENGLQEDWFEFQNNCIEEIAIQWLDTEKIPWVRTRA